MQENLNIDIANNKSFTILKTFYYSLGKNIHEAENFESLYTSTNESCDLYNLYDIMITLVSFIEYMYIHFKRYFENSRMQIYIAYKDNIKHSIDSVPKEQLMKFNFTNHVPENITNKSMAIFLIKLLDFYFQAKSYRQMRVK